MRCCHVTLSLVTMKGFLEVFKKLKHEVAYLKKHEFLSHIRPIILIFGFDIEVLCN